jgi:hypothetical protein
MTHPSLPDDPPLGAIVYAEHMGFYCSICAPRSLTAEEVEGAAMLLSAPRYAPWKQVDKSKPPISIPGPTPNPCNIYPDRLHWFLVSEP